IKSVLSDAMGAHLDSFQRIVADPASISVVRYTSTRPFVLRTNDTGSDLSAFVPKAEEPSTSESGNADSSDAVVGGGAGR
ncbi:MAG: phosphoglycerate mutase, partial [Rhodococcus sp. (in: high G+C Gram-positive bacteria)]